MIGRSPTTAPRDSLYSRDREKMLEHLFLSRLLREAWSRRRETIEVLHPEVDSSGYDVVLEHRGVVRHVQFKATKAGSEPGYVQLHLRLASKPAGCAILLVFNEGNLEEKLNLRYFFFGGGPHERMTLGGFRVARRSTANSSGVRPNRMNVRDIPRGRFNELANISRVYDVLFGEGQLRANPERASPDLDSSGVD